MDQAKRVVRRFLAKEWPSEGALRQYLKDHPKADRANHWVKPKGQPKKPARAKQPTAPTRVPDAKPKPKRELPKVKAKPIPESKSEGTKPTSPKPSKAKKGLSFKGGDHPFQSKTLNVVSRKKIGKGAMGAEFIEVKDKSGKTHKGVWKSAAGETTPQARISGRDHIKNGTFYVREVLCSDTDEWFGGKRVVPKAFIQELEDDYYGPTAGSIHEFVPNTVDSETARGNAEGYDLARSFEAKKMFFMDIITANDDRHVGNSLWLEDDEYGYVPVAIDNGMTYPDGPSCRFLFAIDAPDYVKEVVRPNEETEKCLENLDLEQLVQIMDQSDTVTPKAKALALARAQALKNDPECLVTWLDPIIRNPDYDMPDEARSVLHTWINWSPKKRLEEGLISQKQLDEIYRLSKYDPSKGAPSKDDE